jgi:DNA-binding NtrC family response regulator
VRELYNAVARYVALGDLAELERAPSSSAPPGDLVETVLDRNLGLIASREVVVREFERRYLERMLQRHGGNVTRAAEAAGIARRYFHQLLARLGPAPR